MKSFKVSAAAALVALSFGGAAQATVQFDSGLSSIFFNNFENLYRASTACTEAAPCMQSSTYDPTGYLRVDATVAGNIYAGDIFVGILNVQNVDNINGDSTYLSSFTSKFTGYFAQEIASITGAGATGIVNLKTATDPFGILSAGEMFRLYDASPTWSSGGTVASGIAAATAGTFWGSLGLGSEGFGYTSTDLGAAGSGTSVSTAFLALDLIMAGPAYSAGTLFKINDDTENTVGGMIGDTSTLLCTAGEIADPSKVCTDFTGISRINGNGQFESSSPWMFKSNDPFNLNRVPEPGSLALLGLGLAGLSLVRRRRSV